MRHATVVELCLPRVEVAAVDDADTARWKGAADRLVDLERAALEAIQPPSDDVRVPIGVRTHVFEQAQIAEWVDTAKRGVVPINQRRERLRVLANRSGSDDAGARSGGPRPLR